jgi:hypothetical protein
MKHYNESSVTYVFYYRIRLYILWYLMSSLSANTEYS